MANAGGSESDASPVLDDGGFAIDAAVSSGADAAPPGCQLFSAFSSPSLLSDVSSTSLDNAPTLSGDELTILFHSTRPGSLGGRDLWMASRPSTSVSFDTPVNAASLNSTSEEFSPSITASGLEIYFATSRAGGLGSYDIWKSTRPSSIAAFAAPERVANINSGDVDYFPTISSDGLSLYFASDRSGGEGNFDTWIAKRNSTAEEFGAPTVLAATNSGDSEEALAISADGLSLFIQSTRAGGLGSHDVWLATRASTALSFSVPTNVAELNDGGGDQATWISPDELRLYQSSTRDGNWSLYLSERTCL
jgi:Tol biopolymer transport system component